MGAEPDLGIKTSTGCTLTSTRFFVGFNERTIESPFVQTITNDRVGVFRITEADRKKLERVLYRRYPRREWGTFFRFGFRTTSWGIHLCFVDAFDPHNGDLDESSSI